MDGKLKIAIAADHGGFNLKEDLKKHFLAKGYDVQDYGINSGDSCDYPLFGRSAARAVSENKADFGVLVCTTGFGMCIVANKTKRVRSAVCDTEEQAESARKHNHCNILALGAKRVNKEKAVKIAETFFSTAIETGRHERRVNQISDMENEQ